VILLIGLSDLALFLESEALAMIDDRMVTVAIEHRDGECERKRYSK
jgi:hypothetical protein